MSVPAVSTDNNGNTAQGTPGSSIGNDSATNLSSSQFLDLMMVELTHQDPTNPDSSDPTQYLTQLAQLTSVEQETNTAQNTSESATEQAVGQAVGLIGDTVTYVDQKSGDQVTGTVNSVQITSSGPSLTVDNNAGIDPATVINVSPAGSSGTDGSGDSGDDSGSDGSSS